MRRFILYARARSRKLGRKIKNAKTLRVKCGVLFIARLKVIKNAIDFFIYLFLFNLLPCSLNSDPFIIFDPLYWTSPQDPLAIFIYRSFS